MKKFTIENSELMGTVDRMAGWATDAVTIAVGNKKIEDLTQVQVTGYDGVSSQAVLSMFVTTSDEPFSVVLDWQRFSAAVKTLSAMGDDFVFSFADGEGEDGAVELQCGPSKVTIPRKEEQEKMPSPKPGEPNVRVTLAAEAFKTLICKTAFAGEEAAADNLKQVAFLLDGNKVTALSTNRHMFATATAEAQAVVTAYPEGESVPGYFYVLAGRISELTRKVSDGVVNIFFFKNKVMVNNENDIFIILSSNELGYDPVNIFDRFSSVREGCDFRLEVDKKKFRNMFDVALLGDSGLKDNKQKVVFFSLEKDGTFAVSDGTERNITKVALEKHEGALESICCNSNYLRAVLGHMYEEKVIVSGGGELSPLVFAGQDEGCFSILCPINPNASAEE